MWIIESVFKKLIEVWNIIWMATKTKNYVKWYSFESNIFFLWQKYCLCVKTNVGQMLSNLELLSRRLNKLQGRSKAVAREAVA